MSWARDGGALRGWLIQLKRGGTTERVQAAQSIAQMGPSGLSGLWMVLQDSQWVVRRVAVDALSQWGLRVLSELSKGLEHPHPRVRLHVAEVLGGFGKRATSVEPALRRALSDREWGVRFAVAEALRGLGRVTSIPAFLRCVRDAYWRVRASGMRALGDVVETHPIVMSYLRKGVQDAHEAVRYAALGGLKNAAKTAAHARRVVPIFVRALKDPTWRVRWAGADALGHWRELSRDGVPALIRAFHDAPRGIQVAAALALGDIGRPAKGIIREFVEMLERDDLMHVVVKHMWSPLTRLTVAMRLRPRLPYVKLLFGVTRALKNFGPLAVPEILRSLRKRAPMPNPWLLFTLGSIGTKAQSTHRFVLRWQNHGQTEIRWVVLLVAARLAPQSKAVRAALWRGRKDSQRIVRLAAAQGLAWVRDPGFLQTRAYQNLQQDESRERQAAKNFLLLMQSRSLSPQLLWK